jgi:hypothetical protein
MSENKRTTPRFPVELVVEIGFSGAWEQASTGNVSLGGFYLATDRRLEVGTKVRIRLSLPGTTKIESEAIVRWHDTGGMGLQFDGLRARDVYALGKYLEAR